MSKVWRYGDHVDTDVIIPARYLNIADFDELAEHAMEDIDTTFASNVQPGDYVVAGKNFGCGSSREHAPVVIKVKGVKCIIADSFARIFTAMQSTSGCRCWKLARMLKNCSR